MSIVSPQDELFEQAGRRSSLVAAIHTQAKPQDRQQAAFHRLIKQIDEHRRQIEEWRAYGVRYNQRVAGELLPLYAQIRAQRCAVLRLFDAHFLKRNAIRGKVLRRKLCAMILDLARDLLAEEHDDEIIAVHDRYSDVSHSEEVELDKALSQSMIESMFGVSLGDEEMDGAASMEEMLFKAANKLKEKAAQESQEPPRRKSAKAAAAEEKRLAAEREVSQSVREVYRKLASALHPDRASSDLTAEQKTALMARVNCAYDAGNLLELLNIQLEIEQIDAAHLANLSAERVAHYNQVLREQLAELKSELECLLAPFRRLVGYTPKLRPAHIDLSMAAEIKRTKLALRQLEREVVEFEDAGTLAAVLKDYQEDDGFDEIDEINDLMLLDALFDAAPKSPSRRRGKR